MQDASSHYMSNAAMCTQLRINREPEDEDPWPEIFKYNRYSESTKFAAFAGSGESSISPKFEGSECSNYTDDIHTGNQPLLLRTTKPGISHSKCLHLNVNKRKFRMSVFDINLSLKTYLFFCGIFFSLLVLVIINTNTRSLEENQRNETFVEGREKNSFALRESMLNFRSFLNSTSLFGSIDVGGSILGLTVLNSQLFVVQGWGIRVHVYNTNNFTLTSKIKISGSSNLRAIVASSLHNCLYISDTDLKVVYRYNLSDNVITNWSVIGECYGLSLTNTYNVLVTLWDTKQIKEYTPDGSLVKEISLDRSLKRPWHSVRLSIDQLVVSHGGWGGSVRRVCIVDMGGFIITCYGGARGSGNGQLFAPSNLAVDGHGNVLVTDTNNNRVVLLSPLLNDLGYITIPGYTLHRPSTLHLDEQFQRLYIGEYTDTNNGRVFVLTT